jgi:hypothetical protein
VRSFVVTTAAVAALVLAGIVVFGKLVGMPFGTTTRDHSAPPVLLELRNLADFHASQARFEVTIDQEKDVRWLPSFLAGERVQYIAVGTVDGVIDFSTLADGAVKISADNSAVSVVLPPAYAADPVLDQDISHVMNRDRGLLNRVGGMFSDNPTSEHGLVVAANDKIAAAAAQTDLIQRAQDNTASMLTAMLHGMGFDQVDVSFQVWSAAP